MHKKINECTMCRYLIELEAMMRRTAWTALVAVVCLLVGAALWQDVDTANETGPTAMNHAISALLPGEVNLSAVMQSVR